MSTKWEYLSYIFNVGSTFIGNPKLDGQELTDVLNRYGSEGWELVSLSDLNRHEGGSSLLVAVFKKPVG